MGSGTLAVIHASPYIPWHGPWSRAFRDGLAAAGIPSRITSEPHREGGFSIVLGTTFWRAVEASGPYLLVDRCSFGDPDRFVSLVWNGHGRRGDHRVPARFDDKRWRRYGFPLAPWRTGTRVVLCGQTEPYGPMPLEAFYRTPATHFRRHPAGENPTGLPSCRDWVDVGQAITLNSSVGVAAVMSGVPTVTLDEGAMAWDVTSHAVGEIATPDRQRWCEWLAWTQWTQDEISEGVPWAYHL